MREIKKYLLPSLIIFLIFIFFVNIFDSSSNKKPQLNDTSLDEIYDLNIDKNEVILKRPENGFSPYNSYCGFGVYDKSTENNIVVTAPKNYDIVIFIKNVNTGKNIRNEYIRSNSTFNLTSIPNGQFKFIYIYGNNWDDNADFKDGLYNGNFLNNKGVSKSDEKIDFKFKIGYTGSYSITLQLMSNGNLNTIKSNENDI